MKREAERVRKREKERRFGKDTGAVTKQDEFYSVKYFVLVIFLLAVELLIRINLTSG